jgi:hypothetical protein
MTSGELADAVPASERHVREWLAHQAASNHLADGPANGKFALPEEQAMDFAVEDNPIYLVSAFGLMAARLENQPKVEAAFRTGGGIDWGDPGG